VQIISCLQVLAATSKIKSTFINRYFLGISRNTLSQLTFSWLTVLAPTNRHLRLSLIYFEMKLVPRLFSKREAIVNSPNRLLSMVFIGPIIRGQRIVSLVFGLRGNEGI
jgi:hypothetical protein